MNKWVKAIFDWAQTKGKQIPNNIKEMIDKIKNQSTLSVRDLATIIRFHPDTEMKRNEWLGLTFHFYRLQLDNVTFCLETKGKDNHYILMCQVFDENGIVSEYTSYNNEMSVHDRMKVPLIEKI